MEILLPRTLEEALAMKADRPDAVPIAGGTDLMVELNAGRLRPQAIMDISRLPELAVMRCENGSFFLGACVTYSRIARELPGLTPLVQAARAVGSPQIRNRGTVGGNLGTASPAGDTLPVLAAWDAEIVLGRAGGSERSLTMDRFMLGPKRTAVAPEELILGARWRIRRGPGSFSKVGMRSAMVIAVASVCLTLDEEGRVVRVALGSVGPTVLRAPEAEEFASRALADAGAWDDPEAQVSDRVLEEFGERVAGAARPIDDVRGTAAYRRHACAVLARRALRWALEDRRADSTAAGRGAGGATGC